MNKKKWMTGLVMALVFMLLSVYIFIPNVIHVDLITTINTTREGVDRSFLSNEDWTGWWPGSVVPGRNGDSIVQYEYKKNSYRVIQRGYTHLLVSIEGNQFSTKTTINAMPQRIDTVLLKWNSVIPTSFSPIKRVQVFFATQNLKKDLHSISQKIASYYSNPENIYRIKIHHELVRDSLLLSTSAEYKNYPSTNDIYSLIQKLKNYIASQSAKETGFPMLNISMRDSSTWLVRVALPVNKNIEGNPDISFKRMLGMGKILMTEIEGGPGKITNALTQMGNYVNDHHYAVPAIPFQSLITDRTEEPDTSKWKTRIYYPVMY